MMEDPEAPAENPESATNEHDVAVVEAQTEAAVEIAQIEAEAATNVIEAVTVEDEKWREVNTRLLTVETQHQAILEKLENLERSSSIPETSTETTEATGPQPEVILPPSEPLPAASSESAAPTSRKRRWI